MAAWVLYDNKDTNELFITSENTNRGNTIVPAGGFLVVYRNGDSDFALNNTGEDSVRLYDGKISEGANLIDSYIYTINALEGKSFARIPDGSDNWVDPLPTPGEPNILGDKEIVFGKAIAEEGEEGYIEEVNFNEDEVLMEEFTTSTQELAASTQEADNLTQGFATSTQESSGNENNDLLNEEKNNNEKEEFLETNVTDLPAIEEEPVILPNNDSEENSSDDSINNFPSLESEYSNNSETQ